MTLPFDIRLLVYGATALVLLRLSLWRALLWWRPSWLRLEEEDPAEGLKLSPDGEPLWSDLRRLGFVPLGSHVEKAPLKPARLFFDFGHPGEGMFASVLAGAGAPKVTLWTALSEGGLLCTSNARRPALEWQGRYFSGALEGASVNRLFQAHRRRAQGLKVEKSEISQKARMALARMWLEGPGKVELRVRHFRGLLWTLAAFGILVHLLVSSISGGWT